MKIAAPTQAERILVIGDAGDELRAALDQAAPGAEITMTPTVFDGLAELVSNRYAAVLANAEPIERRPEAAVKQLRELAGETSRLLIFGNPTLEPLARKMVSFGVDDYFVTPTSADELQQLLATPALQRDVPPADPASNLPVFQFAGLQSIPLADIVLDSLLQHPADPAAGAIRGLNDLIAPDFHIAYLPDGSPSPAPPANRIRISHPVRVSDTDAGEVQLLLPPRQEQSSALQFVTHLASLLAKISTLQERHASLQKLAITDDLTGLYNVRYFRHFLSRILENAKERRSVVALSIFDIDNFKHYNDKFGHCVGDEILKQTATLIKRCVREHDHVARIGGDEFAVVFWEKEAPRQPHHEGAGIPGRPPQTPEAILNRFQAMMASQDLTRLGASGKGTLTISAGLAMYPWEASSAEQLIKLADEQLMFGAKKEGKNSIKLVGDNGPKNV